MKHPNSNGISHYVSAVILALFLAQCNSVDNTSEVHSLYTIPDTLDPSVVQATGAHLEVVGHGKGNAWQVTCKEGYNTPELIIHEGKQEWKLSQYVYLAVDITNRGDEDVLVECRPRARHGMTHGSGNVIPAGGTRTLRCYLSHEVYPEYLDQKFFGMFALPGGLVRVWSDVHTDSINRFSLVLIHPPEGTSILVDNLRGEVSFSFLTEEETGEDYFPLLDEFGQFRHKDWPGKTYSMEELLQSAQEESLDISGHPAPQDWDPYGGWLSGPQLEATGAFRTEKVNGEWWLVDPDGHLFWSHGIALTVTMEGQETPVNERSHYFSFLPDSNEYGEFYGQRSGITVGHYTGRTVRSFNQYGWNLSRKYEGDWRPQCASFAVARLKSWGMNTAYSGSVQTLQGISGIPYAARLSTRSARRIKGSTGYWGKFTDPFDEGGFRKAIRDGMERIKETATDPYCIGYFVDNEMSWGDNSYLARSVVQSDPDQPAKLAMLDFLKTRYDRVAMLNSAWQTGFGSWQDFLENTRVPENGNEDLKDFTALLAHKYFREVKKILEKAASGKLYLGCRFNSHFYPDEDTNYGWVIDIAAEYCDVVSFNRYRYSAIDLKPGDADVPVIIGEFHMGAMDRGMLHYTLRFAENQQHRAELYKHYVHSCLKNPFIVGAHWYEYADEPTLGRFDGENFNTGFVDICDRSYPEMVQAAREMGASMYKERY